MTIQHADRLNQRSHLFPAVAAQVKKEHLLTFGCFRDWESSSTSSTASSSKTETGVTTTAFTVASTRVAKEAGYTETVENMVVSLCDRTAEDDASVVMTTKDDECPLVYHSAKVQDYAITEEPLKYNIVEENADDQERQHSKQPDQEETTTKRQKTSAGNAVATSTKRRKRCAFNETVRVVPIPLRTAYSHRVRDRIWSNSTEIQENAARNTIEFASEGWDWRAVLLDEAMHYCTTTGELIHPIHYESFQLDDNSANAASTDDSSSTTTTSSNSSSSFSSISSVETNTTSSNPEG